jgi:branched-chain amino acid transport system permease protein
MTTAMLVLRHGLPLGVLLRGLAGGGALALAALGIALVYRIDRVVNFAQAGIGGIAAVCAVGLSSHFGWPWILSFPVGALGGAALGALMSVAIIDRLRSRPRVAVTVATVGIAEVLAGGASLLANAMPVRSGARSFLVPWHVDIRVAPVLFHADTLLAAGIVIGVVVGIEVWFAKAAGGIAFRAASENPERARLAGTPVAGLAALAWAAAGLLAAVAVMLQTQMQGVSAGFALVPGGPSTLLRLLAAAVLGGMGNLRRTFAAGLAIGVLDEVATWTYGRSIYVDVLLVALLVAALLVSRDARTRRAHSSGSELASREARPVDPSVSATTPWRVGRVVSIATLVVTGATVPLWARPSQAHALGIVCVYAVLALSLLILTGWAGQVSLGQFALAGLGGAVTSVLYGRHGWDITLAIAAGVVVAALAAVLLGLPALRLQGPFFAVTTLGFAVVAASYLFDHRFVPWLVQEHIARPVLWQRVDLTGEKAMYEACFVVLAFSVVAVLNLRRSRFGRMVIAVRENEGSAAATGLRPARAKLAAFAVAGGLAGLAGGLYVLLQQGLQLDAFAPEASLRLFAVVVVGGLVSVGGVVAGAVLIRGTELLFPSGWALLASGAGITALVGLFPEGIGGALARVRQGIARRVGVEAHE